MLQEGTLSATASRRCETLENFPGIIYLCTERNVFFQKVRKSLVPLLLHCLHPSGVMKAAGMASQEVLPAGCQ